MKKKVTKKYKFAVIATDVVILTVKDDKLRVLLMKMTKKPYLDHWAVPGGLVSPKESIEQAAKRILNDKVRLKNVYLEQLYTFGKIDRDPFGRVVSVAYLVLIPDLEVTIDFKKLPYHFEWCEIDKMPALAYDHEEVIKTAVSRLKAKLEYTNIVCNLMPQRFTLGQLQKAYEMILKRKLDKRNFRKKLFALKIIKKTGKLRRGEPYRPAELFEFTDKKQQIIRILR